ncbi:heavy metal transporter [Streptomyces sp. SB3404]|uniref:Heavy metal transporter n=2 Tax=Streptomyces boncukensis TaxID=2711219 RepID=A0A6G4WXA1_9ACTN|nr:heavy metal transporter [Streptomyces boncukensis]NGO69738.1 heavy metal transporter [Streptomyces boncukensis]
MATACAVALGLVAYLVVAVVSGDGRGGLCVVRATGGGDGARHAPDAARYELTAEGAANAATITAVASRRGLPERAVTIALATALQESGLRNIGHGDRDSLGLFQQRPSKGWGTERQILDPVYSAGKFYDHLVKIPGYSRLPLTVAAQRVQRSGYPQAYAKHEAGAALLTAALTGRRAAALSCTTGGGDGGGDGEPGDPERVRAQLVREFGRDVLTASPKGGAERAASGHRAGRALSPAADSGSGAGAGAGRKRARPALSLPVRGERQGWELAHWAVAQAGRLRIERVVYDGRVWSADRARDGWRKTRAAADGPAARAEVALRLSAGQ